MVWALSISRTQKVYNKKEGGWSNKDKNELSFLLCIYEIMILFLSLHSHWTTVPICHRIEKQTEHIQKEYNIMV